MKFLQFKFWLVLGAMLCASCANDRITSSANKLSTNKTNSAEVTSPVGEANATPAKRELDVPYVPTHETIVDAMLEMAEVKGTDILHDLGSGDGRIPITAAKRFGTRGVGIDLNPQRVKEANENAQKAGVTDKVKFIEGDLFQHDFSEATVVTLYLLPEVNMRLRPKILEETPDGSTHYVYFWRVPEKK
jgi:hypothetical protein